MDAAVLAVAPAAHRQQGRPAAEIDAELVLDRMAQCRTGQRGDETGESRSACETVDREAAVAADLGKIGEQRGQRLAPHKLLDDDEIERVADKRRHTQTIEIEEVQAPLRTLRLRK